MFLEQGIKPNNFFGKYLLGIFIIFFAYQLGSIPLILVGLINSMKNNKNPFTPDVLLKSMDPNLSLFLMLILFVFAAVAIYLVIKYLHQQTILSITTSRKKVDFKRIFFSFSVWGLISVASVLCMYFISDSELVVQFQPDKFAILCVIVLLMMPIQTSAEEYVFRGYLMQGVAGLAKNRWLPLVITSFGFGLMHIANPEVTKMGYSILVYYIGTGFFLGIITLMDEGMELALGFHAANNIIGALLVSSDFGVFQTYAIFKDNSIPTAGFETVIVPVFILFPLLLFIFSKKYGWTNWQEKLTGKILISNSDKS
jgi:membrane protease YdiL (CAAX protease family)